MTIKGFDYKTLAENLSEQAEQLVPADIDSKSKEYLIKTMINFVMLSGEALNNDETLPLDAEQARTICQIIAEWTFHKIVVLSRSGIDSKYWDGVLQKIAFTAFEVCKLEMQKKTPCEELAQVVEHHVVKAYKEAVKELEKENKISDEVMKQALEQSNIDKLSAELAAEESVKKEDKEEFSEEFKYEIIDSPKISLFQKIKAFLFAHHECKKTEIELEEIRSKMEDLVNPDRMYERLGCDIISLQVGAGLLSLADPDQNGKLLAKNAALRQKLTDDYGYIIPNVRIMDTSAIEANEYVISIRNNIVERGYVYPGKYMVIAEEWDERHEEIPENAIIAVDPISKTQAYWLSEETANEYESDINFVDATDVIINHIGECAIKYVDKILTEMDVEKYIKLVKSYNTSQINYLMEYLTIYDIRRIFVNLVREKVSIKDICFVFMKLCEFVKYTTEIETLSEILRVALARQICLKYADEDNVLYCLTLSNEWSDKFQENIEEIKLGTKISTNISPQVNQLVESVTMSLMRAHQDIGLQPVLVCTPNLRRQVYEFLVRHIPTVVVLSTNELVQGIKVERVEEVKFE